MSVPQWNADIITPEEEGSGTKVLDGNQVVQPTLEGGTNITISDGTISATGGGAEYYAGEGIVISNENAISVTETVRDGAALGATSVQPADLSGYVLASSLATVATSGDYDDLLDKPTIPTVDQNYNAASTNAQSGTAVASALSGKQDTISDLETIRSGAAAGATAVQPSSLATVATTGNYSDLSGKPTIPTVDQTYNSASTNAQSGVAVASAIAGISVDEVPTVTSSDDGKVLKATYSGGTGSYAWATESGGGASYTAGDGISIANDEISVKAGTGLEISDISIPGGTTNLVSQDIISLPGLYQVKSFAPLTSDLLSQMANGMDVTTVGNFVCNEGKQYYAALYTTNLNGQLILGNAHSGTGSLSGTVITFDTGDIDTANSTVTLAQVESDLSNYRLGLLTYDGSSWDISKWSVTDTAPSSVTTATYTAAPINVQDALCVSNPLPASAVGDAGKILTVNAQGAAAWGMLGSVTSIQQVNALPATPDANTLYLIPEA